MEIRKRRRKLMMIKAKIGGRGAREGGEGGKRHSKRRRKRL